MGDVVLSGTSTWRRLAAAVGIACCLTLLAGCSGSAPAKTAAESAPVAAPAPAAPAEVTAQAVREGAPGMQIELSASGPLVWTSYRDASGRLVVELPNARPTAGVTDWSGSEGLIASVAVGTVEITGTPPIAAFQHSGPVFLGSPVLFANTTTPGQPPETSYLWDFGDDLGTSAAEHPVYTYTQAGTYTVWLSAANLAGSDAISADVQVLALPETHFRVFLPLVLK